MKKQQRSSAMKGMGGGRGAGRDWNDDDYDLRTPFFFVACALLPSSLPSAEWEPAVILIWEREREWERINTSVRNICMYHRDQTLDHKYLIKKPKLLFVYKVFFNTNYSFHSRGFPQRQNLGIINIHYVRRFARIGPASIDDQRIRRCNVIFR